MIGGAPNPQAALLMLIQWRSGLRITETLALEASDLVLESDQPTLRVREGRAARPGWCRSIPSLRELTALSWPSGAGARVASWKPVGPPLGGGPPRRGNELRSQALLLVDGGCLPIPCATRRLGTGWLMGCLSTSSPSNRGTRASPLR